MTVFILLVLFLAVDTALFVQFYQPQRDHDHPWVFFPGSGFIVWWRS